MKLIKCISVLLAILGAPFILNKNVLAGKENSDIADECKKYDSLFDEVCGIRPSQRDLLERASEVKVFARPYQTPFLIGKPPEGLMYYNDFFEVILELKDKEGKTIYSKEIDTISASKYTGEIYSKNLKAPAQYECKDVLRAIYSILGENKTNAIFNELDIDKNHNCMMKIFSAIAEAKDADKSANVFNYVAKAIGLKNARLIYTKLYSATNYKREKVEKVLNTIANVINKEKAKSKINNQLLLENIIKYVNYIEFMEKCDFFADDFDDDFTFFNWGEEKLSDFGEQCKETSAYLDKELISKIKVKETPEAGSETGVTLSLDLQALFEEK